MKKLALCFIAFLGIFGSSAFADDRLYRFSQSDMDMIFHRDSAPLELAMLSPYEMQTTEGEWLPFMGGIIGGAIGGAYNIGQQIASRSWSWRSFGRDVRTGTMAGMAITNPYVAARFIAAVPGAMLAGAIERRYFGTKVLLRSR